MLADETIVIPIAINAIKGINIRRLLTL